MKWPEHCFICWPRVSNPPRRPAIYNPATGHAFCRVCEALPGFWRTFWDSKSSRQIIRAVKDEDAK